MVFLATLNDDEVVSSRYSVHFVFHIRGGVGGWGGGVGRAALHKAFREAPSKLSGNAPLSGNPFTFMTLGLTTQFMIADHKDN